MVKQPALLRLQYNNFYNKSAATVMKKGCGTIIINNTFSINQILKINRKIRTFTP